MDDLCPKEDAVSALLEFLVEPKLPATASAIINPSQSDMEGVAKQVHAVVLLYNYYYRKQQPTMEFMGVEDFTKLAAVVKPSLQTHFLPLQRSSEEEAPPITPAVQNVMEACEIAQSLDASSNAPSMDGWLVSKVAVLLVDTKKENCYLQFGSNTEGVWSLIEKDVNVSALKSKATADSLKQKQYTRRNSAGKLGGEEAGFQQLAFSAVKDATGIRQSDLVVLESHVVYSLSKVKTTARFYIIQCTQPSCDNAIKMPLENVLESLQGPLFMKSSHWWSTTEVIEYFHLLPYAKIISDWLSRKGLPNSVVAHKVEMDAISRDSSRSIKMPCETEVSTKIDKSHPREIGIEYHGSSDSPRQSKNDKCCGVGLSDNFDGRCNMEVDESYDIHSQGKCNNTDNCAEAEHDSGANLKAGMVGSYASQLDAACSGENGVSGNKVCNNGSSSHDEKVISESAYKALDKLSTFIASKDREISQAALAFLLRKRDNLSFQQREIEDQIAECDNDINTILNGDQDDLDLKVKFIIERCTDVPCSRYETVAYQYGEGGFEATVSVRGTNFEWSSGGELRPKTREARESAAAHMLVKLRDLELPPKVDH
ncbi:hypothetical protein Tsubulata_033638 [Turnera subulata]|uniref:DRBM domain-containing protein n=1 Tax=Turnera subulata TaxID=218843 RepID=A0A9Q0G7J2_9ROSI|nr:hypothetical protein Tsubulata_033638 [Turnera subulata]